MGWLLQELAQSSLSASPLTPFMVAREEGLVDVGLREVEHNRVKQGTASSCTGAVPDHHAPIRFKTLLVAN